MKVMALLMMTAAAERSAFGPLLVPEEQALWAAYRQGMLREWFQPEPLARHAQTCEDNLQWVVRRTGKFSKHISRRGRR